MNPDHIWNQIKECKGKNNNRDDVISRLSESNIPTAVHYPIPVHMQSAYKDTEFKLSISEYVSRKILCIPMHPYLSKYEQDGIIKSIVT